MKQELQDRLAALSPAQRALVELRLKKKSAGENPDSIPRRKQQDHCRLSFDQERLWFIQQLDPASAAYNIYTAFRFRGTLQVPVLTRALNEIVRRHEIMRTSFLAPNGTPVQVIAPELEVSIPLFDLRAIPADQRQNEADRLASALIRQSFDLAQLPLFRCVLLQLAEDDFICPTVFHHIITDWIAFHTFKLELATLYQAFLAGLPSPLEPLPLQFADFAVWQREALQGDVLSKQMDYWRKHLEGIPPLLELPTDRPRPSVQTGNGFRQPLVLSKPQSDFIRATANRHEATLFITLLAIFKVLLFRLTGQNKIIVGSPIANRNHSDIEKLLGFFINHLVFCTDVGGNLSFDELLQRVRKVAVEAYANQDVPFGRLVDELGLERDLSRTPITQVVFLFLNPQFLDRPDAGGPGGLSGLPITPYTVDSESSKFDMTFSLWDEVGGFFGLMEYNTDLFDRTTVLRMCGQFRTLLAGIMENPQHSIAELPLLTKPERQQIVVEWNDTAQDYGPFRTVVDWIEEQARLRPDHMAVFDGRASMTFDELNCRANQLAHTLLRAGVKTEARVLVLLERSIEMVAAWLAVLKGGGAYVPVAKGTPQARWERMFSDAEALLLLSSKALAGSYTGKALWVEECVDGNTENLEFTLEPENLAYVIFTSGSTGWPKGVAIEHRALMHLVQWQRHAYEIRPGDRGSQVASAGFDIAGSEIWPYLASGASVMIAAEKERSSPADLVRWVEANRVTHCFMPTPLAEIALDEQWGKEHLRALFTGGDRLTKRPGKELPCNFWNLYGPTEATVFATSARVEPTGHEQPDIGMAISNMRAFVLDQSGHPAPVGVIGELYLGGIGLARGYLGQPELTAEKFVPDAISGASGERLYRTGDLVRWRRDGCLAFIGRADEQIKLRGYRIELGEIEAQLAALEGVRATAVIMSGEQGRHHLTGYVTGEGLKSERLRIQLQERLPEYMVPAYLQVVDAFPLTANGKVDRAALAKLAPARKQEIKVLPRTPAEILLSQIWCEVLGRKEIGIDDNFFQLGGDSILSIQIVAKARQAGLSIEPRQVFEQQTIAALASVVTKAPAIAAEQRPVVGPTQLTPIQLWFFERNFADVHHFNQAVLLKASPKISFAVLQKVAEKIESHHDALRMRFNHSNNSWRAEIAGPKTAPVLFVDLSSMPGESQRHALETTASMLQKSLHLQHGPLFRFAWFQMGLDEEGPARLLVIAHHLVVDGISWRILLEDLETGCRQAAQDQQIQFPQKTTSVRQWAEQLQTYAQQEEVKKQVEWWKATLGPPPALLSVDYHGRENTVESSTTIKFSLTREETEAMLKQGIRIQELLLTACVDVITTWSAEGRVVVDVEGHGREDLFPALDISRTVGWFTTIYPVAFDFTGTSTGAERLKLVRQQLHSIPAHGIGYGLLRYLNQEARYDLEKLPQSAVVFNYLGRLDLVLQQESWLQPAPESYGDTFNAGERRKYLWEIDAGVVSGCLQVRWTYSRNVHSQATMEQLGNVFLDSLRSLLSEVIPETGSSRRGELAPGDLPAIKPLTLHQDAPLSFSQEQMWAVDKALKGTPFFNFSAVIRLQGKLNLAALQASAAGIVHRHHILRTNFIEVNGRPVQRVTDLPFNMSLVDLTAAPEEQRIELASKLADREAHHTFDVSRELLLRVICFRMGEDDHRVALTMHHIVTDGWSTGLFIRELTTLYAAYSTGAPSPLPPLPVQYSDFAAWERQQAASGAFAKQLEYWLAQMQGNLRPLELPIDGVRGELGFLIATESFIIGPALCADLHTLCGQEGASLFMALLAAFALVVVKLSAQEQFRIGILVANRNQPEMKDLIGLFMNTLLLRFRVHPGSSYRDVLRHTREVFLETFEHQDVPFELLLQELEQRGVDRSGLCQVVFVMQPPWIGTLQIPGLRVSAADNEAGGRLQIYPTAFELIVNVAEAEGKLLATITFKPDLFRRETIQHIAEEWLNVLRTATHDANMTMAVRTN